MNYREHSAYPIPSNDIAAEDEINNPQENGIEIEFPFDADTQTEQQIENGADSEYTSNASDEITAPENQQVMTPPTQEELIAIAKNEIIEQLMSSIESAKIDTQHFVASTISNNINSILLEKQNQDLIDYNAINTTIREAITSNLNSDKTKYNEDQAETQRMLEAVATQIKNSESNTNSNLEKINQSLSAHSKDEAKIASNIEAIKMYGPLIIASVNFDNEVGLR
ncbi:hypothetical protein I3271_09315 [Photobacterium leiognathi]|uniref:hypothetical protein n=1 Tax=Photobacterium leiognathi TaxID=553611 RepID=UPI001EE0392C|nr:hypothetical protein [Photobacterium leiognathi]MCG3884887.1 hypothetical protein [Photobacterium leiognathi]